MNNNDLRIKSWINAHRDLGPKSVSRNSSSRSRTSEFEWDFSDSASGSSDLENGGHNSSSSLRKRAGSIHFAEEDQVLEFQKGVPLPIQTSTPEPAILTNNRMIGNKPKKAEKQSSFDWDFSDEEHQSLTVKAASPNRSPVTSSPNRKRIIFAPPKSQDHEQERTLTKDHQNNDNKNKTGSRRKNAIVAEMDTLKVPQQQAVRSTIADRLMVMENLNKSLTEKLDIPRPGEEGKGLLSNWEQAAAGKNPESKGQNLAFEDFEPTQPRSKQNGGSAMSNRSISLSSLKRYTSKTSLVSTMDLVRDKMTSAVPGSFRKRPDETKLRFVVAFFFLVVVLIIALAQVLYAQHKGERRIFGNVKFEEHHGTVTVFDSPGNILIEGHIGVGLPHSEHPYRCKGHRDSEVEKCLEWHKLARLTVTHRKFEEEGINCYNLFWQSLSSKMSPMDCFEFNKGQGHWYGGGESLQAAWPLEKGHIKMTPFVTGDEGQTEWGNAIKKYFANSNGVILTIADHTPLYLSIDHHHGLCIQARFDDFAYFYHRYALPRLNYTLCTGGRDTLDGQGDMAKLHRRFLPKSFWDGHTKNDLDTLHHLMKKPLWQVPTDEGLDHNRLRRYLEKLFGSGNLETTEDRGYLLLNYHWQESMGDLRFNNKSFPNVKNTVSMIRKAGLKLVLTVNPFVSTMSPNFAYGVKEQLFVLERTNASSIHVPALTWFKDVVSAGMLDITYNKTAKWFRDQLQNLIEETHLDEQSQDPRRSTNGRNDVLFYLDTGNTFHTPTFYQFQVELDNPDLYRDYFINNVMDEVGVIGVSGASSKRPKAPAFIFLSPLESGWDYLRSIIPNMMQMSVVGYPFVNPGPVGGMGHFKNHLQGNPEKPTVGSSQEERDQELELYVRWWQLNTFLPMLHFLKPPTAFPKEKIEKIAQKLKTIRDKDVLPHLINFGNEAMRSSMPVIRPMWMIDSFDPVAQVLDDQFMIGDMVLVAPVLKAGQRTRNVYLPRGEALKTSDSMFEEENTVVWRRGTDGTYFKGGRWLNDTQVDLDEVLYFIRQTRDPLPGFQ